MARWTDPEKVQQGLDLLKKGKSISATARELGVSRDAVRRWKKDPQKFLAPPQQVSSYEQGKSAEEAAELPKPQIEYVPQPKLPAVEAKEDDVDRCGHCQTVLDSDERPSRCPKCGYLLRWPQEAP